MFYAPVVSPTAILIKSYSEMLKTHRINKMVTQWNFEFYVRYKDYISPGDFVKWGVNEVMRNVYEEEIAVGFYIHENLHPVDIKRMIKFYVECCSRVIIKNIALRR
jgi:hypothetical protein